MQIWRLPSISLEKSNEISIRSEQILREEFPEIKTIISRTGRAEIATDPMGVEISDVYLILNPRKSWRHPTKEALVEAIDHTLQERVPGAVFSYSQPIQLRVSELISGTRSDVAIKIYGDDLNTLKQKADEVARIVKTVDGSADVKAEQVIGLPTLRVRLDRESLARYGVHAKEVLSAIETIGGEKSRYYRRGSETF